MKRMKNILLLLLLILTLIIIIPKNEVKVINYEKIERNATTTEESTFNALFEGYKGVQSGTSVKALIDTVRTSNTTNTDKIIKVTYNGNIFGTNEELNTVKQSVIIANNKYNVEFEYKDNKYISNIKLTAYNEGDATTTNSVKNNTVVATNNNTTVKNNTVNILNNNSETIPKTGLNDSVIFIGIAIIMFIGIVLIKMYKNRDIIAK